jgi:hypothetical protein
LRSQYADARPPNSKSEATRVIASIRRPLMGTDSVSTCLKLTTTFLNESATAPSPSAEYELCGIAEQRPGVLDELAAERTKLLEQESAELQQQAEKLADEIKELSGQSVDRIA